MMIMMMMTMKMTMTMMKLVMMGPSNAINRDQAYLRIQGFASCSQSLTDPSNDLIE